MVGYIVSFLALLESALPRQLFSLRKNSCQDRAYSPRAGYALAPMTMECPIGACSKMRGGSGMKELEKRRKCRGKSSIEEKWRCKFRPTWNYFWPPCGKSSIVILVVLFMISSRREKDDVVKKSR